MPATQRFALDVEAWATQARVKAETFLREFTQDMAEAVVQATPGPGNSIRPNPPPGEPTGFLRGSWYASLNGAGSGPAGSPDPSGAQSVASIALTAAGAKLGDSIFIQNNAEYAGHLEYGTRKMAPRAFVRGTIARAPAIAKQLAARLRGSTRLP